METADSILPKPSPTQAKIPILLYHFPQVTGHRSGPPDAVRHPFRSTPNIIGMKEQLGQSRRGLKKIHRGRETWIPGVDRIFPACWPTPWLQDVPGAILALR